MPPKSQSPPLPTDRTTRSQAQQSPSPAPSAPPPRSRSQWVQSHPSKPPFPSYNYTSTGVRDTNIANLSSSAWQVLVSITLVALLVRLFRIYQPTSVVFDEVHFGGFASKYIKGKFFMDVHPPLAKLLITLAGWLGGFDGEFDFKDIGKDYIEPRVPYVAMRLVSALLGVFTVPVMFLALKVSGCRTFTAAMGALLVVFENGLVTQSRLILLDSPLVFFTALTALSWMSFTNQHELGPTHAFKPAWWFWLSFTGLALGATVSVKWVGLFTIAWVGALTALQLWVLLGDSRNVTPRLWFKHLFARTFCLIVIPIAFYMFMFAIHFICLVNPGEGDGFMSSEFQATLNTKSMADVPADVAFGSRISLRHHNTQGGYLHSHPHMYPTGSKQQQITLYPHKDENNIWLLENQTQPIDWSAGDPTLNTTIPGPLAWDTLPFNDPDTYIWDGAILRLYHVTSDRRLHSHDVRAPITEAEWQNEVSAYGYEGFEGDANDLFRVEIIPHMSSGSAASKLRLRTIETKFKLVHIMTGCVLFSHKIKLPDWGFEQQEVTCAKGGTLPNSVWYIEQNAHPSMNLPADANGTVAMRPDIEKVNYRNPGFLGKFWELQRVMWTTNAGLVEAHAWDSRPPSWPTLRRGINFWGKEYRQIYLLGNPAIWWSSTAAVATYLVFKALALLRWQRQCGDYASETFKRFDYEVGTSVLGWAAHFLPFFLMQRQLFLHHYFPALVFALMAFCQVFDFVLFRVGRFGPVGTLGFGGRGVGSLPGVSGRPWVGWVLGVGFLVVSVGVFWLYAPLAYGGQWTKAECERVKLFDTWDWDCNNFPESYESYAYVAVSNDAAAGVTTAAVSQAEHGPPPPIAEDPSKDVHVTPGLPLSAPPVLSDWTEEKVEYRDEEGNILNEEQVAALVGKVSFETKYETKTRLLDQYGREIYERGEKVPPGSPMVEGSVGILFETHTRRVDQYGNVIQDDNDDANAFAGTSAEGPDPATENAKGEAQASKMPPKVNAAEDVRKEKERVEAVKGTAEPESEVGKETGKDEL